MSSSGWVRPRPRTYEYNYKIQAGYYESTVADLRQGVRDLVTRTYAEDIGEALKASRAELLRLQEIEFPKTEPLWKKHPYYVPVDAERTLPHEGSVWPEGRKHFDLVSSYDLMVGYLGIKYMGPKE